VRTPLHSAFRKFASLFLFVRERLKTNRRWRFIAFALAANVIGYTLVFILHSRGVSKWWANESVSKGMAPVGLMLNTLALTGRIKPTYGQAAKWTAWWVPSALVGAACTGWVVSTMELGTLECRALAGAIMFPVDYSVKRFIVYYKTTLEERAVRNQIEMSKAEATGNWLRLKIGI
jgi:hypothetical protein